MKNLFIQTGITVLILIFFKPIENALISWNFSWTFSKTLPYLLLVTLGFTVMLSARKFLFFKLRFLRPLVLFLILIAPFALGFALHPIYEGDYSKNGKQLHIEHIPEDFVGQDFVVLAIPGCPYCHESTAMISLIKQRNPKLKIRFIVCAGEKRELKPYQNKLDSSISVTLPQNMEKMLELSGAKFPCFICIKSDALYVWGNNEFGVRARDWMEKKW